jgi:hypothetical protein
MADVRGLRSERQHLGGPEPRKESGKSPETPGDALSGPPIQTDPEEEAWRVWLSIARRYVR